MTSLTPVRYQAVLGSLPGPGSILDRIRAAAEPNASKIGSMPAAKLSNCRRKTLERRLWPGEEEASAETGGLAPRGCARHGCSSHKPTMGRTGCHWLRRRGLSAAPRCQLSPLHALFDEEARRDRGARARVRRRACRAAALQPPATACGHHGTERRRHGQLRRPGAAGGL